MDCRKFDVFISHNRQLLVLFLCRNRQLEDVSLVRTLKTADGLLTSLKKLQQLKSLVLVDDEVDFASNSNNFQIDSLKSFTIQTTDNFFLRLLETIRDGCKNIESLLIWNAGYDTMESSDINVICGFDKLKNLELKAYDLSFELLQVVVRRLPNLVSLSIGDVENLCSTQDDLFDIVLTCHKLSLLTLTTDSELSILEL